MYRYIYITQNNECNNVFFAVFIHLFGNTYIAVNTFSSQKTDVIFQIIKSRFMKEHVRLEGCL